MIDESKPISEQSVLAFRIPKNYNRVTTTNMKNRPEAKEKEKTLLNVWYLETLRIFERKYEI